MPSLLLYWRSIRSKPGLKPGGTIQRLETVLKSAPIDKKLYQGLCKEWDLTDYGVLPPVFPAIATFMTHLKHLADPKFPFQAMGTMHIRTVIEQVRPIRLDEHISIRCSVEGHREVDRGVEFDMLTEVFVGAEKISTTIMTMYRRSALRKKDGARAPLPVHNHINAHEAVWQVDQSTARRYARLTGDINPIHISTFTAKLLGFKAMMLHGMWSLGRACAMHPIQMMANHIRIESEFKSPIFLPSGIRYRWWEDQNVLEMRVLDKHGSKPHMLARLTSESDTTKSEVVK